MRDCKLKIENCKAAEETKALGAGCQALVGKQPRTSAQRLTSSASSRRGVLLLVILGMLALFLMIGTAFVVSSNQYRRANKSYAKVGEQDNLQASQDGFLGEVINQIIRDTTNQNSALRFHSLLRDLYGTEGFRGEVFVPLPGDSNFVARAAKYAGAPGGTNDVDVFGPTAKQFIEFSVYETGPPANPTRPNMESPLRLDRNEYFQLSRMPNYYAGQLLTWTTGPMAGRSTRIVAYRYEMPSGSNPPITQHRAIFTVVASPVNDNALLVPDRGARTPELTQLANIVEGANPGAKFIINGRPFNGTGVGYNPIAPPGGPKLDGAENVLLGGTPTPFPIALMPNAAFFEASNDPTVWSTVSPAYFGYTVPPASIPLNVRQFEGIGGSDESYDAADFQNMFLAWTSPQPEESVLPDITNPANPPSLGAMVLPSYHRPELVNYWLAQLNASTPPLPTNPQILRKILMRPNWFDHPGFSGSNPEFDQVLQAYRSAPTVPQNQLNMLRRTIYGPWDVDNDMDGIRDSVWVDFGAPVMVGASGKLVKPLAAIMVLDMDGRLNVNAHGTRELAGTNPPPNDVDFAGGIDSDDAPRGQAYGPAEIVIPDDLFGGNNDPIRDMLRGQSIDWNNDGTDDEFLAGRYGYGDLGGFNSSDDEPGNKDRYDLSAQLKMQGYPTPNPLARSNFGSFPDLRARFSLGLNDFGQAITDYNTSELGNLIEDSPYELDLSSTGHRGPSTRPILSNTPPYPPHVADNPFSPAELERVLRAYDIDAGTLPSRLYRLLGIQNNTSYLPNARTLLTTDSFDLPEPGVQLPDWVRNGPNGIAGDNDDYALVMARGAVGVRREPVNATFADLIEYRLLASLYNGAAPRVLTNAEQLQLQAAMRVLIAPEMMAGLKLDLNRPLGNGRDDTPFGQSGHGVVDEPGELEFNDKNNNGVLDAGEEALWFVDETRAGVPSSTPVTQFESATYRDDYDRSGDGIIDGDERLLNNPTTHAGLVNLHNYRRQFLARHLYVLAMATVDPLVSSPSPPTATDVKFRARQLAQWAVNVVDFRDADNIMTAFEYDENPFDGWGVDGNVADTNGLDATPTTADDDVAAQREVVWGLEKPELLMTEAIAWHDRRTEDTTREEVDPVDPITGLPAGIRSSSGSLEDTDPSKHDPHMDQTYRPKGAAFVELFAPAADSPGASADTHAIQGVNFRAQDANMLPAPVDGTDLGVNLSAVAVDPADNTRRSPVWRIQVVRNRKKASIDTYETEDIKNLLTFYDPEDRVSLPVAQRPDVDRTIYFARQTTFGPAGTFPSNQSFTESQFQSIDSADGAEFFTNLPIRPVRPGTYMVVGGGDEDPSRPGIYTSPVGLTFKNGDVAASNKIGRRIELHLGNSNAGVDLLGAEAPIQMFNKAGPPDPTTTLRTPKLSTTNQFAGDVAVINRVIERTKDGTPTGPANRSFSLSEPANGYPNVLFGSVWSTTTVPAAGPEVEGWYVQQENPNQPNPIDIPLDDNRSGVLAPDPDLRTYGTVQGYRWMYLQRLANPLLPFNPEPGQPGHIAAHPVNPYLTIDQTSVNLSVFNGLINAAVVSPSINPENGTGADAGYLSSVERGWRNHPADLTLTDFGAQKDTHLEVNPYHQENSGLRPRDNTVFPSGSGHFFNAAPDCTLGFLNRSFNANFVNDRSEPDPKPNLNVPDQPMPWLTWNNRPFANPGELMQVPNIRSSQLGRAFTFTDTGPITGKTDTNLRSEVFRDRVNVPPQKNGNNAYSVFNKQFPVQDGPFGHLMNYFRTEVAAVNDKRDVAGLYRVLDFVTVPSLYVGTETWLNPGTFGTALPVGATTSDPRYSLQPPFNKISSRCEPGRVNINTIASENVWKGMFHADEVEPDADDEDHAGPRIEDLGETRRGYGGPDDARFLDANFPSFFCNPFRSAGAADMVPLSGMIKSDIHATLLRNRDGNATDAPLSAAETDQSYRNSKRNPYFRYSPISRLSSMTTTRSNVFAIWVTIGFFEVEEAKPWASMNPTERAQFGDSIDVYSRVYPDGYTFGKEAGIDTGEIQRVREFAIVDRTIPAAFEPGANHNTEETVRLRRKIE